MHERPAARNLQSLYPEASHDNNILDFVEWNKTRNPQRDYFPLVELYCTTQAGLILAVGRPQAALDAVT